MAASWWTSPAPVGVTEVTITIVPGKRPLLCHAEAFIATCDDFLTNLPVSHHSTRVWHEHSGLTRNVGAQIPGVFRQRQQRLAGHVVDLRHPFVDRVGPSLN